MGLKSFSFDGLTIFGTGHTIYLSIDEFIIWTISEAISSATGLRNFTGILSKPLERSFLNSDIMFLTSVYVVCCITQVLSFSNSGKLYANNDWSKAMFFLFVSVEASSMYYRIRSPGSCFIWFVGGSSIPLTVSHTSVGFLELGAFRGKVAFLHRMVFFIVIPCSLLALTGAGFSMIRVTWCIFFVFKMVFRRGTHLYMSLFPSVRLSVRPSCTISQEPYMIWS